MRIISRKTLLDFYTKPTNADAEKALRAWYFMVKKQAWKSSHDAKRFDGTASIISAKRIVFNICGNKYRLVVAVNYKHQCIYIRFIETHKQYNKIDATTI